MYKNDQATEHIYQIRIKTISASFHTPWKATG